MKNDAPGKTPEHPQDFPGAPDSAPKADDIQPAAPDGGSTISAPPPSSLEGGRTLLSRSRLLGRVSAVIFLIAAFCVLDGLQTLVRHEFNSIDLIPGETILVSGMMPADARSHEDLVVEIEGDPGLAFTPLEVYKGFWMGGLMWRAELSASPSIRPGTAVVTVVDIVKPEVGKDDSYDDRDRSLLFGGRQNPALVHTVTVYATEAERRQADDSLVRRATGVQPFAVAAACALLGIAFGFANLRVFSRAERELAPHGFFVIHGVKDMSLAEKHALPGEKVLATSGYRASFTRAGQRFAADEPVALFDRAWNRRAQGRILDEDKLKGYALFPANGERPRYGWIVARDAADGS